MPVRFALSLLADAVDPHPDLAPAANWPGVVVIIIVIGFFGTAMVLGPIVRALMHEDPPD
jgi:hypothetical protein